MPSSLGVFIDKNIIKYAKLQKEKDDVKVEAFNVAFTDDNLEDAVKKIVSETYSFQVPVSINLSDEIYCSFDVSNLLSKNDKKNAIKIEYEMLCSEKGYNQALLDNKYVTADNNSDAEKEKITNIIANKNEMAKRIALFSGNKVSSITPMPVSIVELLDKEGQENVLIVNIESKTQITTVFQGKTYAVDTIEEGMGNILDEINKTENSYSKSYEACKNMTIFTQNASELYDISDPYMSIVSAEFLKIIDKVKMILNESFITLDKVYITGSAICINNIDLFFQEFITNTSCEILKPYFLKNVSDQTVIKEYMDVNSAIALALAGLNGSEVNFSKSGKKASTKKSVWKKSISIPSIKSAFSDIKYKITNDFTSKLQNSDKLILRSIFAITMIIISYIVFSNSISNQLSEKSAEIKKALSEQQVEMQKMDSDISIISGRTVAYKSVIEQMTNPSSNDSNAQNNSNKRIIAKDAIPNMLNRIMFVIPKKVRITSIKNTTNAHIEIVAESEKYEQLGYFKAVLLENNILLNVKSTPSQKNGNIVGVILEGDLP